MLPKQLQPLLLPKYHITDVNVSKFLNPVFKKFAVLFAKVKSWEGQGLFNNGPEHQGICDVNQWGCQTVNDKVGILSVRKRKDRRKIRLKLSTFD